jgi:L-ascorbate metabolism protein UlaG (beta-lactamase superfamily)
MAAMIFETVSRWASRAIISVAVVIIVLAALIAVLLNDRPSLETVAWPNPPVAETTSDTVTATWLGVTTLLFDDGETQILIDAFFSRPSLADIVFGMPVESEAAQINYVMDAYGMRRLAAIIPVHSHFDHAMDVGAIANRSSATILGSGSTAQIARGAGVPEDQIIVVADGERYAFGRFTVRMIETAHAPIGWGGSVPVGGTIDVPLETPAPITAWREGGSFSVLIAHPAGTTLVHGSAGFTGQSLRDVRADVVMLGTFGLDGFGNEYARRYWQTYVTATGALSVIPVHFDDYTGRFGEIRPFPRIVDNFAKTARLLENIRQIWDTDTRIYLPEFGQPIELYPRSSPEA